MFDIAGFFIKQMTEATSSVFGFATQAASTISKEPKAIEAFLDTMKHEGLQSKYERQSAALAQQQRQIGTAAASLNKMKQMEQVADEQSFKEQGLKKNIYISNLGEKEEEKEDYIDIFSESLIDALQAETRKDPFLNFLEK